MHDCARFGIRTAESVATHPLMGNLFENFVVAEEMKRRFNRGEEADAYFYRNSSGTIEVYGKRLF